MIREASLLHNFIKKQRGLEFRLRYTKLLDAQRSHIYLRYSHTMNRVNGKNYNMLSFRILSYYYYYYYYYYDHHHHHHHNHHL